MKTRSNAFFDRAVRLLWLGVGFVLLGGAAFASSIQIAVRHTFGGEPLQMDSLRYKNAAGETLSVTRVSYLLSGFAFEKENGTWVEVTNQFAWLDAGTRRESIRLDAIPEGRYRALHFYFGPDALANHADPAKFPAENALNPNLNGLHWNWQGGYIFLALEGLYRASATSEMSGFAYHFARDPNRVRITLTGKIDLTQDAGVQLDFDLGTLLNAPRPLSFANDGSSTHSREGDSIAAALAANLQGAFNIRQIESAASVVSKAEMIKPLYLPEKFTPFPFKMGAMFPIPALPRDNPLIEERVALGKKLFNETALSRDGAISCASCHQTSSAFADPRRFSVGVRDQTGTRQAMPLFNLAWKSSFFWDGRAPSLRAQALIPIQDHTEMDEVLTNVIAKLANTNGYGKLFEAAFGSREMTSEKIGLALEQFMLTLTSYDSKFDRARNGQATLSTIEQQGFELFMTEYDPRTGRYGADCFHCHGGPLFSDHQFHNNGLDAKQESDPGRFKVTQSEADRGKFSTPSLRNVELTAPYMHDGRFATLEAVIEHYSGSVKRSATLDPNIAKHPVQGLDLSAEDKQALVAFLKTLTDEQFKTNTIRIVKSDELNQ